MTALLPDPAISIVFAHGVVRVRHRRGGVALLISFVVMAFAWRQSRSRGDDAGVPLPTRLAAVVDSAWTRWLLRLFALAFTAVFLTALVFGPDRLTNPAFGVFYVLIWVGIVPASLLLGHIWRLVSPVRLLHLSLSRLLRTDPDAGLATLPSWVGYWPAALGLLSFIWRSSWSTPAVSTSSRCAPGWASTWSSCSSARWRSDGPGSHRRPVRGVLLAGGPALAVRPPNGR